MELNVNLKLDLAKSVNYVSLCMAKSLERASVAMYASRTVKYLREDFDTPHLSVIWIADETGPRCHVSILESKSPEKVEVDFRAAQVRADIIVRESETLLAQQLAEFDALARAWQALGEKC